MTPTMYHLPHPPPIDNPLYITLGNHDGDINLLLVDRNGVRVAVIAYIDCDQGRLYICHAGKEILERAGLVTDDGKSISVDEDF